MLVQITNSRFINTKHITNIQFYSTSYYGNFGVCMKIELITGTLSLHNKDDIISTLKQLKMPINSIYVNGDNSKIKLTDYLESSF